MTLCAVVIKECHPVCLTSCFCGDQNMPSCYYYVGGKFTGLNKVCNDTLVGGDNQNMPSQRRKYQSE